MAASQGGLVELTITRGVSDEYRDEKYSGPGCGGCTLTWIFSNPKTKFSLLLLI